MNNYNKKYRRFVEILIEKNFRELRNKKIFVFEIRKYFFAIAISFPFLFFNFICPTRKARTLNDKALKGVLAHELCHFVINKKKSFIRLFLEGLGYYLFRSVQFRIERETELEVIKKGFGKELLEATKFIEKAKTPEEIRKRGERGYLSIEEIKKYLKQR